MSKVWWVLAAAVAAIALAGCASSGGGGDTRERDRGGDARGRRIEVRDPDRGKEGATRNPVAERYENRAYPRGYVTARDVERARSSYRALPTRLSRADFDPQARGMRSPRPALGAPTVGADWSAIGPLHPLAPAPTTESLKDAFTSGRVTALAVSPNCDATACRLWVAAAGGGIWRTNRALRAGGPDDWTPLDDGLPTNTMGALMVDPNDASGNTLYAGTGEANAINQAGLGLFKSTDGGDHWSEVAGAAAATHDRSISAIAISSDGTIWIGTALGRNGQSSVNGGQKEPPGAPRMGVYRSTDDGAHFTRALSEDPQGGTDLNVGGVTHIEVDPNHPQTVYAGLYGMGVYRTTETAADGDQEQVFAPQGRWPDANGNATVPNRFERTEFSLVDNGGGTTRAYLADGWLTENFDNAGEVYRADDVSTTSASGTTNTGWTELSSSDKANSGFGVHQPCQGQCDYDLFVAADPAHPDTVWIGGSMVYEEIRPLQDQSLAGTPNRSNGRAVMRSTNSGATWQDMTADITGDTDYGQPGHTSYEQMHPDQHALVFDPSDPNIAFIGSDGGVVRTDGTFPDDSAKCAGRAARDAADGVPWDANDTARCQEWLHAIPNEIINMNDGLATLQFQSLSFDPRDPLGELLAGTQDNGTWAWADGSNFGGPAGPTWFESVNGDGGQSGFDVGDPNVRIHSYFTALLDVNHHGTDPTQWTYMSAPVNDSGEFASFYVPLATDPRVSGTIYLGAQHVWRTKDNGGDQAYLEAHCAAPGGVPEFDPNATCGDWEPIGPDLTTTGGSRGGQYLVATERAPSDTGTLWAATRLGRLFVSKNADAAADKVSFTRIDTAATPGRFVSGIAVDAADANHAYVSYSGYDAATPATPGHVFDVRFDPAAGSATFKDVSFDLGDQPIDDVEYDDGTGDVYAATDDGVARLPAGATKWQRAAAGFPLATATGISLSSSGRVLYAATYGRSAYRLALPPAARIDGPDALQQGETQVYDGGHSSAFAKEPLSYTWTLPDGSTRTGRSVAYTASGTGAKTLTLTVTAPDGRKGTATRTIAVSQGQTGGGGGNGGGGTGGNGGNGRTTTGNSPSQQRPAAAVALRSHILRASRSNRVRVRLACPRTQAHGCAGTVRIVRRVRGRSVTLGRAAFAIPKGRTRTITVALSRRTLRRVHTGRRLTATASFSLLNDSGGTTTRKAAVTISFSRRP